MFLCYYLQINVFNIYEVDHEAVSFSGSLMLAERAQVWSWTGLEGHCDQTLMPCVTKTLTYTEKLTGSISLEYCTTCT